MSCNVYTCNGLVDVYAVFKFLNLVYAS